MITKITDPKHLAKAFDQGLIRLFHDIFAEPPYLEKHEDREVEEMFQSYFQWGALYVTNIDGRICGFLAATPFIKSKYKPDARTLGISPETTWTIDELGVDKNQRRKRLAKNLIEHALGDLNPRSAFVIRTQADNLAAQNLYRSCGFETTGIAEDVPQKRQDGQIRSDRRVFLIKRPPKEVFFKSYI
jgi:ribosomal protein S18 acetylase RimI-like enzyme